MFWHLSELKETESYLHHFTKIFPSFFRHLKSGVYSEIIGGAMVTLSLYSTVLDVSETFEFLSLSLHIPFEVIISFSYGVNFVAFVSTIGVIRVRWLITMFPCSIFQ